MHRSLTVPQTASLPMSPPGNRQGVTTKLSVENTSCPPGALTVDRAARSWTINRFDCVQCGNCVQVCPKKCLRILPGYTPPATAKHGEPSTRPAPPPAASPAPAAGGHPVNDPARCVYCTLCAKKCPQQAIAVDRAAKTWRLDPDACIG